MNNCPRCGSKVNVGESFCTNCGMKLPIQNSTLNQNTNPSVNTDTNIVIDSELLSAYIGSNVEKFTDGGFSSCAFFFAFMYAFYRKMWLLGITWFVALFIFSNFLPSYYEIIAFIISIVLGNKFKTIYIKYVYEQINKIIRQNPYSSREEIIEICRKKGGTSVIHILIICAIILVAFVIAFIHNSSEKDLNTSEFIINEIERGV